MPPGELAKFRTELGRELRDRRRSNGLTQAQLGAPLTRAFVSLLEAGRTMPSLPVLLAFSERLGTSADEILRCVNDHLTSEYHPGDADGHQTHAC